MPKEDFTNTKGSTIVKDDESVESVSGITETITDEDQLLNEESTEETVETTEDQAVDEVVEKAEETKENPELDLLKQRLDQLELENQALRDSSKQTESTEPKQRTWKDLSAQELKTHRQQFRSDGDHDKADAINDILLEKTRDDTLAKLEQDNQAATARDKSWNDTSSKYAEYAQNDPEFDLNNKDSKLFILADKVYAQNGHLKNIPTGESIAVEMAASELLKGKYDALGKTATSTKSALTKEQSKTSLEGAGRASTPTSSINRLMDDANRLTPGTAAHEKAWQKVMKEVSKQNK